MIRLENNSGETDCNFSDIKKMHYPSENRSVNQLGSVNYNYVEAPIKFHQLPSSDYDYLPRSGLNERLGAFPSTRDSGHCKSHSGEQPLSLISCSPERTNVSVYENLAQNRNEPHLFPDVREVASEPNFSTKSEESKSKMIGMYIVEKTIGKGNFSVVKLATHKLTQVKVAIKIIDKTRLSSENLQKIHREVGIMKLLHHPHIVKLYQVMESDSMIYIVMEYVPNGEIFDYIASRGRFKEDDARSLFFQIVCAIEYCHARHIVHRDLKAENLLLDEQMNIKLADFGFGNFWQDGLSLSTFCGSPPYAAPEIFKGERYSGPKADIWSLGVVLYVLVSGSLPFEERTLALLKERVVQAKYRIPYWMSDNCEDLIKNMLCRHPERRFSVRQILDHRWMRCAGDLGPCGPTPCLADDMRKGIFNEQIISVMQQKKMQRKHIIESLSTCAYDHRTALYLLLGEKLRRRARGSMPEDNLAPPASLMQRRPSSVAESLMANRGPRELLIGQQQQQQQQMQQPQATHQPLPGGNFGNIIDAMQTEVSTPTPPQPTSGANAWHHLPAQLKSMGISQLHPSPPPPNPPPPPPPQPAPSERSQALTICVDVTPPSAASRVLYYPNHHHQFDNGACCLSTSSPAPRHAHAAPVRSHRHRHGHGHSHGHTHAHVRQSPVLQHVHQHFHNHHVFHHHHPPPTQQHLHPAWLPRTAHRPPTAHRPVCAGGDGPVSTLTAPTGHHFNEGRRASDVGVMGLTPVAMETQFAPLRAAARAGGVLDLVPTSEEEVPEAVDSVSGLETVEYVQASQLMPPSPQSSFPTGMSLSPGRQGGYQPAGYRGVYPQSGKRFSLPVACVHAPMDQSEEGGEGKEIGPGFVGPWGGRRTGCQLPTIVSAMDEENPTLSCPDDE